jgi:hypothetical protein
LIEWSLIVKGDGSLDVTKFIGNFSNIDLSVLEMFVGPGCGVASLLAVACDFIDGDYGLFDFALDVQFIRIAKLQLCDSYAEFGAIFDAGTREAVFKFL